MINKTKRLMLNGLMLFVLTFSPFSSAITFADEIDSDSLTEATVDTENADNTENEDGETEDTSENNSVDNYDLGELADLYDPANDAKTEQVSSYETLTLQGIVQDNLAQGSFSISYAIEQLPNTNNETAGDYEIVGEAGDEAEYIAEGYLYASTNYKAMISLPANYNYLVLIGGYEESSSKHYVAYSYYSGQEITLDKNIYFDFLYGTESFIRENIDLLSGGKDEYYSTNSFDKYFGYDTSDEDAAKAENISVEEWSDDNTENTEVFNKGIVMAILGVLLLIAAMTGYKFLINKIKRF